jgi:hypothetical protein
MSKRNLPTSAFSNRPQLLGECDRIVDVEEDEDLLLQHRPVICADGKMEQGFDADEMNGSHHDDADDG